MISCADLAGLAWHNAAWTDPPIVSSCCMHAQGDDTAVLRQRLEEAEARLAAAEKRAQVGEGEAGEGGVGGCRVPWALLQSHG